MTPPPFIEARGITKTFRGMRALDDVSFAVRPASFHAIVGENGAGKSTLVKCLLGYQQADTGAYFIDEKPLSVGSPADAHRAGLGMVFQHFTLIPSLSVAENLALVRPDLPALIDWSKERASIRTFLEHAPFQVDLNRPVAHLAAGEKQKVEILKQLYLETRVLILDEPTSVLTPGEASEILGILRGMVDSRKLSVVMITHKLREVMQFADEVTVLRKGRCSGHSAVAQTTVEQIAEWMIGDRPLQEALKKSAPLGASTHALHIRDFQVDGDNGLRAVHGLSLTLRRGEILGIAGVSGNGQKELVQAIGGQRAIEGGEILIEGRRFVPSRARIREAGLFTLPEEPLQNATVPGMSVSENIALRNFDRPPIARGGVLVNRGALLASAQTAIARFSVRPSTPAIPIRSLSGGNVQRAVLARDLGGGDARIIVVSNPCFGLDFVATAFVHNQLVALRNAGGSVLLASEDLDELLKLSDRIVVMSEGRLVHETSREHLDMSAIGRYMGGHATAGRGDG
jgi:simple sugar transport system ATP-binding protein